MAVTAQIHLARDGAVTSANFGRLGYDRLLTGVYGPARSADKRAGLVDLARATVAAYPNKQMALFGPTALEVLGVALPNRLEDWDNCQIVLPPGVVRPRRAKVVAHQSRQPFEVSVTAGLPLLDPVEHWCQLPAATVDELVEIGDGLVRRINPLTTLDDMRRRVERLGGGHGIKRARQALRLVVPGTDSIMETRTRLILVRAGLPVPAVNLRVYCRAAGRVYHVDMGYEAEKVAVEYDGAVHVGDRRQMEIDAARQRHLQDEGWFVVRVTAADLRRPEDIVRSVESAIIVRRAAAARR